MFKKLLMLFKIGRKLSTSGAISSIYEIYTPNLAIKIFFYIIGFSLEKNILSIYVESVLLHFIGGPEKYNFWTKINASLIKCCLFM